ncbi:MAG: EAL domain-containing protein [Thiobacillus sp.]
MKTSILPNSVQTPTYPPNPAPSGFWHAECLRDLWRLASQYELDDNTRIRAVLRLAAETLRMDIAILGKFEPEHTLHYVYDTLNILSEGAMVELKDSMCKEVFLTQAPIHVADLRTHPQLRQHKMVDDEGLKVYSGLPVYTGGRIQWVLAFLRRDEAPELGDEETIYMELIADWLGNALHNIEQKDLLQRLALTDLLTNLPNRRAAEDHLQQELARVIRKQGKFALAMVDLDHFRYINERYGQTTGDQVLEGLAQRLMDGLRDGDWVARWGGEKFLFFLHDSDAREAVGALERLSDQVKSTPIKTDIGPIALTLSAGIGVVHPGSYDITRALDMADVSLRKAKNSGRDKVHAVLDMDSGWSIQTVKNAVRDNRLRLATQVIVDLQTNIPVADESLARLSTPEGTLIDAERFIGMAEGLGTIADLDRHMSQLSLLRCKTLIDQGGTTDFAHFINLSPQFLARRSLVEGLLQHAHEYAQGCRLGENSINPMVLEITERQRIGNLDTLRTDLKPLLDFGFRLALDDFGSGYSSFMYLANLPISFLKIEGWLVLNMRRERRIASVVESIANFARKEGIKTIAEHVEDAETARILREMGVDWGQGWHFGLPQTA